MATFVTRRTLIEAVQFEGLVDFASGLLPLALVHGSGEDESDAGFRLWVEKSEEWCRIDVGDWIIVEPDGEGFYPCKRAIFAAKYDRVVAG